MTDNEIIEALECCKELKCSECPKKTNLFATDCDVQLCQEAIDLINRLKAEIERLQHILVSFMSEVEILERNYGADTSNIPKIAVLGTERENIIKQTKSEAIKEFAERIKKELHFISYPLDMNFKTNEVNELIDNLVKEMVGDDNG